MKQSIGFTFIFNFFAIFLVVLIFALISIMNYMKAYKVNSYLVGILEKNEGYNLNAKNQIQNSLVSSGYRSAEPSPCPKKTFLQNGQSKTYTNITTDIGDYDVCLYSTSANLSKGSTFRMGVLTYIYIDIPIINSIIRIPVFSTTDSIYVFERSGS